MFGVPGRWIAGVLAGLVLADVSEPLSADRPQPVSSQPTLVQNASAPSARGSKPLRPPRRKALREEALALKFVDEHLPELGALLRKLKQADPEQFRRAVAQLNRSRRRIENWRRSDPRRYAIELHYWKAQQQVKLLLARLSMDPQDTSLRQQLRQALEKQLHWQLQRVLDEQQRLRKRLQQLEKTQRRLESPNHLDRVYQGLLRSIRSPAKRATEPKKRSSRSTASGSSAQ